MATTDELSARATDLAAEVRDLAHRTEETIPGSATLLTDIREVSHKLRDIADELDAWEADA